MVERPRLIGFDLARRPVEVSPQRTTTWAAVLIDATASTTSTACSPPAKTPAASTARTASAATASPTPSSSAPAPGIRAAALCPPRGGPPQPDPAAGRVPCARPRRRCAAGGEPPAIRAPGPRAEGTDVASTAALFAPGPGCSRALRPRLAEPRRAVAHGRRARPGARRISPGSKRSTWSNQLTWRSLDRRVGPRFARSPVARTSALGLPGARRRRVAAAPSSCAALVTSVETESTSRPVAFTRAGPDGPPPAVMTLAQHCSSFLSVSRPLAAGIAAFTAVLAARSARCGDRGGRLTAQLDQADAALARLPRSVPTQGFHLTSVRPGSQIFGLPCSYTSSTSACTRSRRRRLRQCPLPSMPRRCYGSSSAVCSSRSCSTRSTASGSRSGRFRRHRDGRVDEDPRLPPVVGGLTALALGLAAHLFVS